MPEVPEFSTQAFHASLPKGRASGSLRVFDHGLVFSNGTNTVTLPLDGLQLKLGGASNRLIFCTHPALPDWQLYTTDHALLKAPALANHPALRSIGGQRRQGHAHFWGLLAGSVATLALLALLVWWSLDGLSAVAARRIPVEWEAKLGSTVMAQYRLGHDLLDEKEATALLNPLTAPLAAALPDKKYPLHFYIVNDPAINAFALPGGYMVINSGLILRARRAQELQGVLGHEVSHVTEQHGLRAVIRSTGVYLLAQTLLGDASGLVAVMANAGPLLLNQKYSRDFERDADAKGYALLKRANIDPRGMADFFQTVLAEQKKQMEKIKDDKARQAMEAAQGFIGSHPETAERIATLKKKLGKEATTGWRNDEAAFLALQERVRQFVGETGKKGTGDKPAGSAANGGDQKDSDSKAIKEKAE